MRSRAMFIVVLTASIFLTDQNNCLGQSPIIDWQKSLGGTNAEGISCIQQTNDGGFILAGESFSTNGNVTGNHGSGDYWIVKLSNTGSIQWQKSLGGSNDDRATSIKQTVDGGYIIAGSTLSNDGDVNGNHVPGRFDYWIVKINGLGVIQWQKCLGGSFNDEAASITQTADGGYIVAGNSNSNDGDVSGNNGGEDYWIVKLDVDGIIQWQRSLGGSYNDYAKSIEQTSDGEYIVAGTAFSPSAPGPFQVHVNYGGADYWIVKLDSNGYPNWQVSLGGTGDDYATSIHQNFNDEYIVAGYSSSTDIDVSLNHGGKDYWVILLNSTGHIQWEKSFGGTGNDEANSVIQSSDGGYLVAGRSTSNDGDVTGHHSGVLVTTDYWVVKMNATGNLQWQKSLGGIEADDAYSVIQTNDGGFALGGESYSNDGDKFVGLGSSDYWLVKFTDTVPCNVPSAPGAIVNQGGGSKVCPGDTRTYTTSVATGVTFQWTVPQGAVINSGQGTRSIQVTYTSNFQNNGIISVVKVNSCGAGIARNLTVCKNIPIIPSAIVGSTYGLCGSQQISYSVQPIQGLTYNWTVPAEASGLMGQGTNVFTLNYSASNFQRTIAVNASNFCGTSPQRTLVVRSTPIIPGPISGSANVCSNSVNVYSIAAIQSAISYTWTGPAGSHITANGITSSNNVLTTAANTVTISFTTVNASSNVKVRANNNCGSGAIRSLLLTPCAVRIGEYSTGLNATVYPNPTSGLITVQINNSEITKATILVSDISGREIFKTELELNTGITESPVYLDQYKPGVYFITILTAKEQKVLKIIKE